jgi:phosphatidylglycerophosphatase A
LKVNKKNKYQLWFFLASVAGVGLVPCAPGTAASLLTGFILWWVPSFFSSFWIVTCIIIFFVGIIAANKVEQKTGIADPSCTVIDEVVGMAVSLWLVPKTILWYSVAFVVFRFLDIVKPFPIGLVDRRLAGGLGVMADDVVAGIITCGILHIVFLFVS